MTIWFAHQKKSMIFWQEKRRRDGRDSGASSAKNAAVSAGNTHTSLSGSEILTGEHDKDVWTEKRRQRGRDSGASCAKKETARRLNRWSDTCILSSHAKKTTIRTPYCYGRCSRSSRSLCRPLARLLRLRFSKSINDTSIPSRTVRIRAR